MIQYNLTDYSSYKDYFQDLCTRNKSLGANQFIFGEQEVAQSNASDWQGKKLWVWPATSGQLTDDDNFFLKRQGNIWIGGAAPEKFSDQDDFYQECEIIAKQVISRMIYDKDNDIITTDFSSYKIERSEMLMGGTKFIGCEITLSWRDPDNLEYDANNWN